MGWLYKQSLGGFSGPRQYLDHQFTYVRPDRRVRVLRSALVALRTYYAAVEIVDATGTREVIAVVCLVRYDLRDREGFIFGYKDMDESMGPCEAACPARILDLLTPTEEPHAVAWRERCRVNAARRAARPKLRAGQTVVFEAPIRFTDGTCRDRFDVVIDPRRSRAIRFRAPGASRLYHVGSLAKRSYRIEGSPSDLDGIGMAPKETGAVDPG